MLSKMDSLQQLPTSEFRQSKLVDICDDVSPEKVAPTFKRQNMSVFRGDSFRQEEYGKLQPSESGNFPT